MPAPRFDRKRREQKRHADAVEPAEGSVGETRQLIDKKAELDRAQRPEASPDLIAELQRLLGEQQHVMASRLAAISEMLSQRGELEASLREALTGQAELRALLDRQIADTESRLAELGAERSADRHAFDGRLQAAEQAVRQAGIRVEEAEQRARELGEEVAAIDAELDSIRRKYRSTQRILNREKEAHEKTRTRLDTLRRQLDEAHSSLGWRAQRQIESWGRGLRQFGDLGRSRRRRLRAELAMVRASELFDAGWYLEQYPDVAEAGIDPAEHFVTLGWREGRSPGAAFSTTRYLKMHADVAALGVNPLLHYLEHGQFEGRDIEASSAAAIPLINFGPMGPPAPWVSYELPEERVVRWCRASAMGQSDPQALLVDGLAVGLGSKECPLAALDEAIADLQALSGFSDRPPSASPVNLGNLPPLADGWFAARNRLRTRWRAAEAVVIRAIQCDPARDGIPVLVGEGLSTGELDLVEFDVANPLFPLLILASDPQGGIVGATTIAFPSLFRGGLHYAERTDVASPTACSVTEISMDLEQKLRALRTSSANPLVKTIFVDLTGADAAGPMFQPAVREWLAGVIGLSVTPHGAVEGSASTYLAEAARLDSDRRNSGATLLLAADMIPALGLAVAHARSRAASREVAMAFIAQEQDSSQPAIRFDPPAGKALANSVESSHFPLVFPRMRGRDAKPGLAAIRTVARSLSEPELFVPDSALTVRDDPALGAVTWITPLESWSDQGLEEGLAALALQDGAAEFQLCLCGGGGEQSWFIAQRLFGGRASVAADVEAALRSIDTPLIGYLGPDTLLHDRATFRTLRSMLGDGSIASASCVTVDVEQRGKGWRVSPSDAAVIPVESGMVIGSTLGQPIQGLWRSTFAVVEPPRHLWLARRDAIARWAAGETGEKEVHLLTTLVSAGAPSNGDNGRPLLTPSAAGPAWGVRAKVLAG